MKTNSAKLDRLTKYLQLCAIFEVDNRLFWIMHVKIIPRRNLLHDIYENIQIQ